MLAFNRIQVNVISDTVQCDELCSNTVSAINAHQVRTISNNALGKCV